MIKVNLDIELFNYNELSEEAKEKAHCSKTFNYYWSNMPDLYRFDEKFRLEILNEFLFTKDGKVSIVKSDFSLLIEQGI